MAWARQQTVGVYPFRAGFRSVEGYSRRFDRTTATSGLPSATDSVSAGRRVCFVPTGDVAKSPGISAALQTKGLI